jgi:hypothetical protein
LWLDRVLLLKESSSMSCADIGPLFTVQSRRLVGLKGAAKHHPQP